MNPPGPYGQPNPPYGQPKSIVPGGTLPGPGLGQLEHLPDGTPLASVWKRLAAVVLDTIFVSIITVPFVVVVVGVFMGGLLASVPATADAGDEPPAGFYAVFFALYAVVLLLGALVAFFYYVLRVRQVGATFGKQILGLRIRSVAADGQLTWAQAWGRWGLPYVVNLFTSGLVGVIDVLWCLWDPYRQCLHDKAVGTVVIDTSLSGPAPHGLALQRARATSPPRGWLANGPVPHPPAGYPR